MSEPKASDQLIAKFAVQQIWVERDGKTTRGVRPEWLDWPSHTVAEIGPKWVAPKQKGRK